MGSPQQYTTMMTTGPLPDRNAGRGARSVPSRQRPLPQHGTGPRRPLAGPHTGSASHQLERPLPPERSASRPLGSPLRVFVSYGADGQPGGDGEDADVVSWK